MAAAGHRLPTPRVGDLAKLGAPLILWDVLGCHKSL